MWIDKNLIIIFLIIIISHDLIVHFSEIHNFLSGKASVDLETGLFGN